VLYWKPAIVNIGENTRKDSQMDRLIPVVNILKEADVQQAVEILLLQYIKEGE